MPKKDVKDTVKSKYGSIAESGLSSAQEGVRAVAKAFGYSEGELRSIPAEANMGLSCGNPVAYASLKAGETVVDLGCGGGLDVFLAADRVGPTGKAIGIDMTPEMIELARKNALKRAKGAPANVEFHLSEITALPLPDASVDCVISNCVINLVPDKKAVFKEIARVLKPGGRLAVSDIALKKKLPRKIKEDVAAYTGCIAGAIPIEEYRHGLRGAGFVDVEIVDSGADLNAYAINEGGSGCCTSPETSKRNVTASSCCCCGGDAPKENAGFHDEMARVLREYDVNDYAASVKVFAFKPR